MLGLIRDKREDSFIIQIPNVKKNAANQNILSTLASIYDPLGFVSPFILVGKIIYRNLCDLKFSWNEEIPIDFQAQQSKWITNLKTEIKIPGSIPIKNEPITEIDIHLFSDASIDEVCTVAYVIVYQPNNVSQSLITSNSRLAQKNISIPRPELIAAHIFSNLAGNLKCSLRKFNIREVYAWSDSTVNLHLLKDNGEYKVFVYKREANIKEKGFINWKYIPAKQNSATQQIQAVGAAIQVNQDKIGEKLCGYEIQIPSLINQ